MAIDHDSTGSTLPQPTAELRGIELQIVTQHIEQRRCRISFDCVRLAIDVEGNGHDLILRAHIDWRSFDAIGRADGNPVFATARLPRHLGNALPGRRIREALAHIAEEVRDLLVRQDVREGRHHRARRRTRVALKVGLAVIGAGQIELSAYHLRRLGLVPDGNFVIFDQSPQSGGAGQSRCPSLTLMSVNPVYDLPGRRPSLTES